MGLKPPGGDSSEFLCWDLLDSPWSRGFHGFPEPLRLGAPLAAELHEEQISAGKGWSSVSSLRSSGPEFPFQRGFAPSPWRFDLSERSALPREQRGLLRPRAAAFGFHPKERGCLSLCQAPAPPLPALFRHLELSSALQKPLRNLSRKSSGRSPISQSCCSWWMLLWRTERGEREKIKEKN